MKSDIMHGAIAGLLSGITSVIFMNIYCSHFQVDFSTIANPLMIIISSTVGVIIASFAYWGLKKLNWLGEKTPIAFNVVFFILSFLSIFGTFGAPLPQDTLKPELFSGLVIPMHFFPILFWLIIQPLFNKTK